jgi:hypothetical protein
VHSAIEVVPYRISQTNTDNGLYESKRNMAHRTILTERQRAALFNLPSNEAALLRHYTLADDDIEHIRARRRSQKGLDLPCSFASFATPAAC